jgi:acyl-CoA thioester hydrolase
LRALGFSQTQLVKDPGVIFVVASLNVDNKRPARLDDTLDITCDVELEGNVCMRFAQHIRRGGEVLVEASCRVACLDAQSFRPKRIPAGIAGALRDQASSGGAATT